MSGANAAQSPAKSTGADARPAAIALVWLAVAMGLAAALLSPVAAGGSARSIAYAGILGLGFILGGFATVQRLWRPAPLAVSAGAATAGLLGALSVGAAFLPALALWLVVARQHLGFTRGADIVLPALWGAGFVLLAANLVSLLPR